MTDSFTGDARLWVADAVLKWSPHGNSNTNNFKLQGEYFRFTQNGTLLYDDSAGSNVFGQVAAPFDSTQSGWYAQGIWQFYPRWRAGYRYDRLSHGTVNNGIVANGLGPRAARLSSARPLTAPLATH